MFFAEHLISLLAPHDCIACGVSGSLLCDECRSEYLSPVPSRCYRCHAATESFATCKKCRRYSPLQRVWVATEYDDVTRRLVHLFKFERAKQAGVPIANHMAQNLPELSPETRVVPIPTATSRVRQRGYDQATILAGHIARSQKFSKVEAIARVGQTRQVGAGRKQRQTQLEDAYRLIRGAKVADTDILLVDDITTTGSTLETAAKLLKSAGAKSISAVVFAQKQ